MNSVAVTPPVAPTKLCHLVKRPDFEGYGFNLHSEKMKPGQFIGKVDANSPAEAAGLKKGDRIVEVNSVSIGNETHKQVVQRIKAIENEVRLLLIDVDARVIDGEQTSAAASSSTQEHSLTNNTNKNNNNINNTNGNDVHDGITATITTTTSSITKTTTVAPPTIVTAAIENNNKHLNNTNSDNSEHTVKNSHLTATSTVQEKSRSNNNMGSSTLHLPLTAAEMRAKLMSKKKYDAKSETVDIKKKFQIIQTL